MRDRTGMKQRKLLAQLEFVGPIAYSDLDWLQRRSMASLARQGLVRVKGNAMARAAGVQMYEFIEPDNGAR